MSQENDGFLSRWSRRKTQVKSGVVPPADPPVAAPLPAPAAAPPAVPAAAQVPVAEPALPPAPPLPTMDDVQALTRDSDYSRFVARGVDAGVQRAAMKKLFADPRYNVMDGLDVYIEDYNITTPITPSELRQMAQAKFLGLFDDEDKPEHAPEVGPDGAAPERLAQSDLTPPGEASVAPGAAPGNESAVTHDEDPDLRLQPDDAAGRAGPDPSAGRDGG